MPWTLKMWFKKTIVLLKDVSIGQKNFNCRYLLSMVEYIFVALRYRKLINKLYRELAIVNSYNQNLLHQLVKEGSKEEGSVYLIVGQFT